MRILLDESLPRRLRSAFPGHEVATVAEAGWSGLSNGELLQLAAERFDLFVTADQPPVPTEFAQLALVDCCVSGSR